MFNRKFIITTLLVLVMAASSFCAFATTDNNGSVSTKTAISYTQATPPAVLPGWSDDKTAYFDESGNPVTGIQWLMAPDGSGEHHYKFDSAGVLEKDAYGFAGDPQKLYYFDATTGAGKYYTGTYSGKFYKSGLVFSGVYNGKYYKDGLKATGKYKGIYYKNGVKGTGMYKGYYYKNGVKGTGLCNGYYYKKGVKGTGVYKDHYYKKGVKATGVYNKRYYKKGNRATALYKGYYYKNGIRKNYKYKKRTAKIVNGKTYYFNKNSKIVQVKKSGVYKVDNGKRYYFYKADNIKVSKSKKIRKAGGAYYYFKADNSIYSKGKKGTMKISGKTYRMSSKGKLYRGWYKTSKGNKYYYCDKFYRYEGKKFKKVGKYYYYFGKNGKVATSKWITRNGSKYHVDKKGRRATGFKYVGKYKFCFSKSGKLQKDLLKYKGYKWASHQSFLVDVNRSRSCITIYAKDGSKGYTIPVRAMTCSVGKSGTPTITGTYYTNAGAKWRWLKIGGPSMGGYCYGQYVTQISGNYLFHSVLYDAPNPYTLYPSSFNNLGSPASHGCIRLATKDAKVIYTLTGYNSMKIRIHDSSKIGPLGKPDLGDIPYSQTYDPTDPSI